MASKHASLDAAAQERKARLAKLKTLKRKQPPTADDYDVAPADAMEEDTPPSVTKTYLSGRNYDAENHAPKLGFENAPDEDQETLEARVEVIAAETRKRAVEEEKAEKPIDLFKLQPKKPNWDLKRDVEKKLDRLNVQTDNAIAKIVKERIATQKKKQEDSGEGVGGSNEAEGEAEVVGMEGAELVEGVHLREMEEEEGTDSEDSEEP